MPAIQSLTMTYDALNEYGTFSEGDTLTGKVTLALLKDTPVESLFVKAKGDADVRWTKKVGDRNHTYSAHKRYFKMKQFLIPENSNETLVPQGTHVYKFSFTIPPGSSPSSFKGSHGKIVYKLEAKLSRSWRVNRTVETDIHFVSKAFPNLNSLMSRQVGSTKKDMGLFSKGHAHMDVILDRKAYAQGETMVIVANIANSSSSEMIPKFSLIKDVVYRANGHTNHESNVIHKVVDNCVKSRTQRDFSKFIVTVRCCHIFFSQAYLDISFAFDPEVIFPVVIIPQDLTPGPQPGGTMGPYPAGAIGGPSMSDFPPPAVSMGPYPAGAIGGPSMSNFPPPAVSMGPYPVSIHSGSYGYPGAQRSSAPTPVHPDNPPAYPGPPGVYPAQPAHTNGGYNNPVPPLAALYGSPFSSSSSSSVLHPPPTAPTFQPPPPAPEIHPSPPPPQAFNISPTALTYTLLPSAPVMNTDFLSQSDEAPPAYSLLFPSSATDKSVAK
ncbi:arrestin domain-containing protein 3-like [Etheostoma cragini]|uniref:arrestin domain-containing protein 3-like n=1 Tax=Etheostoma cragini TaxID=417921 RepID=UPI00155E8F6F|nr:arrestin domain-containing protein 3-like [Etheostoma cragini]